MSDIGDLIPLSHTFTIDAIPVEDGGVPVDPATVTFQIKVGEDLLTYIYGTDPELVRDAVGVYHVDYTPVAHGTYHYRWSSTGIGQETAEDEFYVQRSNVVDDSLPPTNSGIVYQAILPYQVGHAGEVLHTDGTVNGAYWATGGGGGSGTVTSVDTGDGLQGGPITAAGTVDLRLSASGGLSKTQGVGLNELGIANTTVTPGSYGSASAVGTFTANAQGRLTTAATAPILISQAQVTGLTASLAAKADDATVVHLAGIETITGAKTFSADVTLSAGTDIFGSTTSNATFRRVISTGSAPTVALGISTGAGESITVSGTDEAGEITIVFGSSGINESAGFTLFTVTFSGGAFPTKYSVRAGPVTANAAELENQFNNNNAYYAAVNSSTQWAYKATRARVGGALGTETAIYHYQVRGW